MTLKINGQTPTTEQQQAFRDGLGLGPVATMTLAEAQASVSNGLSLRSAIGLVPMTVTGFGNSIIAATGAFWDAPLCIASGGILRGSGKNGGVPGNTTQMMLDRISAGTTGVPSSATIVPVVECTNDGGNAVTVAQHITNMTRIFNYWLAQNKMPVHIQPPANGSPNAAIIYKMGLAGALLARSMGIPTYQPWQDCADTTTAGMVAGTYTAGDTYPTHPNSTAHGAAGARLWALLSGKAPAAMLPLTNSPLYGLNSNCLFLTNDGTKPTSASGWYVGGASGTYSLTNAADPYRGKMARITGVNGGSGFTYLQGSFSAGFVPGDNISVTMHVKSADLTEPSLRIFIRTLPSYAIAYNVLYDAKVSVDGVVEFDFQVPVGATRIDLMVGLNNAGTEVGYIEVGQVQLINTTGLA